MTTKEEAFTKIQLLVQRFDEQREFYQNKDYNETQTRRDFVDPFWKALGWDVDNESGYAESYREVRHEDRLIIGGAAKAPDYAFRLSGTKKLFFLEAKKPSVAIKDNSEPAYQLRRYGWNGKMLISITTNFAEFAVYDCTVKPKPTDKASTSRIKYLTYADYLNEFDFLWNTFSKEGVLKGRFDKFIESDTNKRGTTTVDDDFLASLDGWRLELAQNVVLRNDISEDELNFVVQNTLDRIVFLRFAEDRNIERYGDLQKTIKSGEYYKNLLRIFHIAEQKYDSGFFDFDRDTISTNVVIDDTVIKSIVTEFYYPICPYEFSVLPVEILGGAYERFLGKRIVLSRSGRRARIEEKPEVCKAGGVYYTPQYIVDYIVENTVGRFTEKNTPKEVSKIKIVDPACGSGSFLIGAYHYLLSWHKNYYTEHCKPSKGHKNHPLTPSGELTISEKKRILLNNIYGVDLDGIAVEVTKLSLLLKCMEGETKESIEAHQKLFHDRVLPDLDENIKCGNSLIDIDYYENELDFGEERRIKPFSWQKNFPAVFKQGGFDCVIGNPPYVSIRTTDFNTAIKPYFKSRYKLAVGQYDLYALFIERAETILVEGGRCGFIMPKRMATNENFRQLRRFYRSRLLLETYVDSGMPFAGASVETNMLIAIKESGQDSQIIGVFKLDREGEPRLWHLVSANVIDTMPFEIFPFLIPPQCFYIIQKIQSLDTVPLGNLCTIIRGFECGFNNPKIGKWKTAYPIIRGEHVRRYHIEPTDYYVKPDFKNEPGIFKTKCVFLTVPKLITKFVSNNIQFALDTIGYCNTNVLYNVHVLKGTNIHYLLGLLNSKLLTFWFQYVYGNDDKLFPHIQKNQLESIPIPSADTKIQSEIVKHVDRLLQLYRDLPLATLSSHREQIQSKIDYSEDRINALVYELYGLTEEEIKVIETE